MCACSTDSSNLKQNGISVKLEHGFEIIGKDTALFNKHGVCTKFGIYKNGYELYVQDNYDEFTVTNLKYHLFPLESQDAYQLLIEAIHPPQKNRLNSFKIIGGKVVSMEEYPTFESELKDLDADGISEVAGYWNWYETYNDSVGYNPIIFYELRANGLEIDSSLTISINTEIYEEFYGFEFIDSLIAPIQAFKNQNRKIMQIKNHYK